MTISEEDKSSHVISFPFPGDIRGIGNWLRHQYDAVDADAIRRTVVDDLPPRPSADANPEYPFAVEKTRSKEESTNGHRQGRSLLLFRRNDRARKCGVVPESGANGLQSPLDARSMGARTIFASCRFDAMLADCPMNGHSRPLPDTDDRPRDRDRIDKPRSKVS